MRPVLPLAVILVAAVTTPAAAEASLHGQVVDAATGAPVAGAVVAAGEVEPVTTDAEGRFAASGLPRGPAVVYVYADGYQVRVITVDGRRRRALRIELSVDGGAGEVIEVEGEAPELAETPSYQLGADQVRALPGGNGDVLRAAQSLPGVGRVPYGLGSLVLRGQNPHDSNVYLDGIEVPIAFHFGGLSSFYPSTLLDAVEISPGGADVAYGRGVGGVAVLRSRAPRRDRWRVGAELGLVDASTYAEGPTALGGAIAVGVRRSYIDAILAAVLPRDQWVLPRYYDAQVRWDVPVAGGTLSALAFLSYDQLRIANEGAFAQHFVRVAARWRRELGPHRVQVVPWIGRNGLGFEERRAPDEESGDPGDDEGFELGRVPFGVRGDVVRDTGWGHLAAGVDVQGARVSAFATEEPEEEPDPDEDPMEELGPLDGDRWYADVGVWVEARWRLAEGRLTVKPGARLDHFGISEAWTVDPRIVATHELTPWLTTEEMVGVHHQPPGAAWLFADDGPEKTPLRAVHASIGARAQLPASIRAAITGFAVDVTGPEPPPGGDDGTLNEIGSLGLVVVDNLLGEELFPSVPGRARSHGVEVSLERRGARSLIWLAYTLSRAERHAGAVSLDGWVPFALDQTHNLSAVGSFMVGRWQLGARLRYVTGFPYTPETSGVDEMGNPIWDEGPTYSERLPSFVSIDVRAERRWRKAWGTISAYLDLQNLTNRTNPEGVEFDEDGDPSWLRGLPILPMFGVALTPPT